MKQFFQRILNWEQWPFYLLYAPIGPVWLWYCLRSGSLWFFSPSNPSLTFGGFEGESKKEMYDQLPPDLFPRTIYFKPTEDFALVKRQVEGAGFKYPFAVKPDVGMKGILFRKIDSEAQLERYHAHIPVEYLVQDLITLPIEVSVFYYRYPNQEKGVVSGYIQKELLVVKGDGQSTLRELINAHPRAKLRLAEMTHRHAHRLDRVIQAGQDFFLSYAGNHNRGARFINLYREIDAELTAVFDKISHYTGQFYYGRYDIKCASLEDLKAGRNFSIIEFNGSGAEPNHIYDCGMGIGQAYREILRHWRVLFEISRYNHRQGFRYWSFRKGWAYLSKAKKHFRMLEKYD